MKAQQSIGIVEGYIDSALITVLKVGDKCERGILTVVVLHNVHIHNASREGYGVELGICFELFGGFSHVLP